MCIEHCTHTQTNAHNIHWKQIESVDVILNQSEHRLSFDYVFSTNVYNTTNTHMHTSLFLSCMSIHLCVCYVSSCFCFRASRAHIYMRFVESYLVNFYWYLFLFLYEFSESIHTAIQFSGVCAIASNVCACMFRCLTHTIELQTFTYEQF